jgi:hypothetical protein
MEGVNWVSSDLDHFVPHCTAVNYNLLHCVALHRMPYITLHHTTLQ